MSEFSRAHQRGEESESFLADKNTSPSEKLDSLKDIERLIAEAHEKKEYRPVGVAVIEDEHGRTLFVRSAKDKNDWSFPQGGIEPGEGIAQALFREVHEETGMTPEQLVMRGYQGMQDLDAEVGRKDKRGFTKGKRYFFFKVSYVGPAELHLQESELAEAKWAKSDEFDATLATTRAAKRNMMKRIIEKGAYAQDKIRQELMELASRFNKDAGVDASQLRELAGDEQGVVAELLRHVYSEHPDVADTLAKAKEVRTAFLMNVQKMVQYARQRKDGSPYYMHPLTVSQKLLSHGPQDAQAMKAGIVGALLHDYLEEGDGVSPDTLHYLQEALSELPSDTREQLVFLTEPNYRENGKTQRPNSAAFIDYDELTEKTGKGRKDLEPIIQGLLLSQSELMQMVVPVDKLDNVGDCDVVQRKKALKDVGSTDHTDFKKTFTKHLAKTLGTYLFYALNCTSEQGASAKRTLEAAVEQKILSLAAELPELRAQVSRFTDTLSASAADPGTHAAATDQLDGYLSSLGIRRPGERKP